MPYIDALHVWQTRIPLHPNPNPTPYTPHPTLKTCTLSPRPGPWPDTSCALHLAPYTPYASHPNRKWQRETGQRAGGDARQGASGSPEHSAPVFCRRPFCCRHTYKAYI